jgi:hypothetical protein
MKINLGISSCEHLLRIYTLLSVTLQRKTFQLAAVAALLVLTAGCSGLNATQSISPASFLLPGLLKADPAPATGDVTLPETPAAKQVALAR